jgi:hypothetical protein
LLVGPAMASKAIYPAVAISIVCAAACVTRADADKPALSKADTEAGLARMFTDAGGQASFTCGDGDERSQYICDGNYVPFDRSEATVKQRFGVSLSHYEDGKPVFAIRAVRSKPSGQ